MKRSSPVIPLYQRYPRLERVLARVPLGDFPTPVEPLSGLNRKQEHSGLYIKRDDLSATPYGGNKIRKLEFLLADARKKGSRRIITSGAAGSNHALATAIYSRKCGFPCTLMLFAQPPAPGIDRQLLADFATGAELIHDTSYADHCRHLAAIVTGYTETDGIPPYVIPAGGSAPTGAVGYVNAAFELAEQINQGILPEPAAVYVTLGTMGTVAGLLIGFTAAGINSSIIAVRVVPDVVADRKKLSGLFESTNRLLHEADPAFPLINFEHTAIELKNTYFGNGYGMPTPEAQTAIRIFRDHDDIALDPVYTGKTAAAFLDAISTAGSSKKNVLFWHTKSACPPPAPPTPVDFKNLPQEFHSYFADSQ